MFPSVPSHKILLLFSLLLFISCCFSYRNISWTCKSDVITQGLDCSKCSSPLALLYLCNFWQIYPYRVSFSHLGFPSGKSWHESISRLTNQYQALQPSFHRPKLRVSSPHLPAVHWCNQVSVVLASPWASSPLLATAASSFYLPWVPKSLPLPLSQSLSLASFKTPPIRITKSILGRRRPLHRGETERGKHKGSFNGFANTRMKSFFTSKCIINKARETRKIVCYI